MFNASQYCVNPTPYPHTRVETAVLRPVGRKSPRKAIAFPRALNRSTLNGRTRLVRVPAIHGLSESALTLIQHDIAVLVLGLEECIISVDPHRDREHVARHDGLAEATVHALKARRIRVTKRMK